MCASDLMVEEALGPRITELTPDEGGRVTISVKVDAVTLALVNMANDKNVSLGKDPIDLNATINEALASKMRDWARANMTSKEGRQWLNDDGLRNPQVGDSWCELPGSVDARVVCVFSPDDIIVHTYVSAPGVMPGRYRINRVWLKELVLYESSLADPTKPMRFKCDRFVCSKEGDRYKELTDPEMIKNEITYATDIRHLDPNAL